MIVTADLPVGEAATTSRHLKAVYDRFDFQQTALIPVKDGQPIDKEWHGLTLKQTHESNYQCELPWNDLAVICGPQSNNLAAIRFYNPEQRQDFLASNPGLKDALLSSFPGGYFVWIRVEQDGQPLRGHKHAICDLVCDGSVLVASKDPKAGYRFDNEGHPVAIKMKHIVWPAEVATSLALRTAEENYPVEIIDEDGNLMLNDDYVIAFFKIRHDKISFNPVNGWFYLQQPDGRVLQLYVEQVKNELHMILAALRRTVIKAHKAAEPKWLTEAAEMAGLPAPKTTKRIPLQVDTGPKHLMTLVELLKILTAKPFDVEPAHVTPPEAAEAAALIDFVQTNLEQSPGGENVTVEELYAAYAEFCVSEGHSRKFTERQFQERVGDVVRSAYGIEKNHRTIRDGSARRGWNGIRLKFNLDPNPGTVGTIGTDRNSCLLSMDSFDPVL